MYSLTHWKCNLSEFSGSVMIPLDHYLSDSHIFISIINVKLCSNNIKCHHSHKTSQDIFTLKNYLLDIELQRFTATVLYPDTFSDGKHIVP